jgi:hypothetical protein
MNSRGNAEARYAIPATAKSLAEEFRAERKANADKGITSAPQ